MENHPLFSLQNRFSLFKSTTHQVRPDISFLCNSEEALKVTAAVSTVSERKGYYSLNTNIQVFDFSVLDADVHTDLATISIHSSTKAE